MKKQTISALLLFVSLFIIKPSYAKEITILYTGSTHAMLYPCSCPIETDGGVARRAALVKALRKKNPNTLLVDAGSFFAGGLLDEYTQNTQLDMQRTLVNLKAMELMKYDAAAIGEDEFNFGADFLKDNINKTKLNFLSCNVKAKEILPYAVKELAGAKIGIIAITNPRAKQKAGIFSVDEPKQAAKETIGKLKANKTDIIVVLSNLNEADNLNLINEVNGIDILINGQKAKEELYSKAGSTLIINPSWQGRKLGVLTLNIEDKKIANFKVDLMRLSDKIKDDPAVKAVNPRCFSDNNCKDKGITGACLNPGTIDSSCKFEQQKKVKITVITLKDCIGCDDARVVDYLKRYLPGIAPSYLYYPDTRANKLIKDLKISGLPAYLFGRDIETEKGFADLKQSLEKQGAFYVLRPGLGGLAYFIGREKKKGKLDLFISLYDNNANTVLEELKEFNPEVHFLAAEQQGKFDAVKGNMEIEEYLRSVCVKKYYPEKFWDYLTCRVKNINSSWWDNCLGDLDPYKIKICATGKEGETLLRENIKLNKELQVIFGPTYLLDNQEIFSTQGPPKKGDFKKIFRK